jgi:inosine/xanthosine triphosphatase
LVIGALRENPLAGVRWVRVGSLNEPKLAAVRSAIGAYAPDAQVEGVAVTSGVPDQPIGFDEIICGARNRAARAFSGLRCDLAVGIEDGLVALPTGGPAGEMTHLNIGCVAITDGKRDSIGFSSAFGYPLACTVPAVDDREPIGVVFDRFWAAHRGESAAQPSVLSTGNIGRLSNGVLPRAEYARQGVLCALVAFLQPDLYGFDEDAV